VTAQGITVAWIPGEPTSPGPNHVPLAPTAIVDRELDARHMYGVSLAMVMYIVEHGGQPALQQALRSVQGADTVRAVELWNTMSPRIDYVTVLDALAPKVFDLPLEQIATLLDGALCCHGLSDVSQTACRVATTRPTTRIWFATWSDLSSAPRAMCRLIAARV